MPIMSSDDFSLHTDECEQVGDGMPTSNLPDEVTSIDDLECDCWKQFDSLEEFT
ncbi:hypothetical protein BDK61_2691 [Haloarcula quadrata]|uniref:Uncharacterized protein n=1 Tax=Haloarcula quadrata TaxID=182779 RepID=A0A495R8D6_9EURY|nr:hypothetical protein BDK61_2691 [Haloarcula quadrata]